LFAIAADVAGTLSFTDLERLEVYLVGYIAVSLLLSLWLLPGLVAALTPIPYRALLSRTKDALILAFMTTSLLAVIPLLTEEAKELIEDYTGRDEQKEAAVDVVVPASFNFPHTGKLLSLTFLFFAGWFSDAVVRVSDYPKLAGAGVMAMFGSVNAAIPFLLDLLKIPADTFRLFVTSSIVNARFGTLVAAVHTATVAVLGTCAVTGLLVFNARKLIRFAIVSAILIVVVVGGTRAVVTMAFTRPYDKDLELTSMKTMTDRGSARVFRTADAPPLPPVTTSVLERVKRRGVIRVGYFDDSLPYVFFNIFGDLVGFDVDMALQFARDLHVQIEFVPVTRDIFERGLDPSQCDVVMSGVAITADRATQVRFSTPYLDETVAFLVPDRFARRYSDWASVQAMGRLRIGVPSAPYFIRKIREELPNAEIVPIARLDDVLAGNHQPLDALVTTAERGSAYTLLHPEYSIAVPMPRPSKIPLAYVVAGRDSEMTSILDTWIELKRKDDTVGALFNHWILGQNVRPKERRWSILDNVLRTSK
jgi:ABC-type amino acid transport substrate-binding protein